MNLKFLDNFFRISGSLYKEENSSIVISMLRKKLLRKKILKDMKDYIEELQCQIDEILLNSSKDYAYAEMSKLCNGCFKMSEEKNTYKRLQKNLRLTNNFSFL